MISVRKLAALDLQFLGPKVILAEFGLGVLGCAALGVLTLRAGIERFHSRQMIVFGIYLLFIGLNYVPLLLQAASMVRGGSALQEIGNELVDQRAAFRKYRRQSLFLLLPLVVPIAAVAQEVERHRAARYASRPER